MRSSRACLMLMLSLLVAIPASSNEQRGLELLRQEVISTIDSEAQYLGSDVQALVNEILVAADEAILEAAEIGASNGTAATLREIYPKLEGWKAQAEACCRRTLGWTIGGLVVGAVIGGTVVWGLSTLAK